MSGVRPRPRLSPPLPSSLFMWVQPEITQKLYVALWAAFLASCFFPYRLVGLAVGKEAPRPGSGLLRTVGREARGPDLLPTRASAKRTGLPEASWERTLASLPLRLGRWLFIRTFKLGRNEAHQNPRTMITVPYNKLIICFQGTPYFPAEQGSCWCRVRTVVSQLRALAGP